jgi:hypothetical protein
MSSPRNTAKDDPLAKLIVGLSPDGIYAQERAGQQEMLRATTLPTDLNSDTREDFEALGFTFGDPVPGDPLFCEVTLPEGWQREGSEHAMWSYVTDERGLRRVAIFYKAAFYDRRAFMGLEPVGSSLANDFIYGDEPEPTRLDLLTEEERGDARAYAQGYLESVERNPNIYGDREPRAKGFLAALNERCATDD